MKLKDLIFLDTETTDLVNGRLVQLAVMPYEQDEPTVQTYKPAEEISIEAMVVHGITNEEVAALPPFLMDKEAQETMKNSVIVMHNAVFDIAVMKREGIEIKKFIDTWRLSHILLDSPSYSLQYLRYFLKLDVKKTSMAHDAGGDVLADAALFKFLYKKMEAKMWKGEKDRPTEEEVVHEMVIRSGQPVIIKKISFGKYRGETFEEIKRKDRGYLEWLFNQKNNTEDVIHTLKHHLGYFEANN